MKIIININTPAQLVDELISLEVADSKPRTGNVFLKFSKVV